MFAFIQKQYFETFAFLFPRTLRLYFADEVVNFLKSKK